jgi:hypothetical protein
MLGMSQRITEKGQSMLSLHTRLVCKVQLLAVLSQHLFLQQQRRENGKIAEEHKDFCLTAENKRENAVGRNHLSRKTVNDLTCWKMR